MKVYTKTGSKERLIEMFQRVNKIKLNENALGEEYEDLDQVDLDIPSDLNAEKIANVDIKRHYIKGHGLPHGQDRLPSERWNKHALPYDTEFTPDAPLKETDLEEARPQVLGKGYTHFAVDNSTGKIVTGWQYGPEVDKESIAYYGKMDLNDQFPDRKASEFKIYTRNYLEKKGIDPSDTNNWYKLEPTNEEVVYEEAEKTIDNIPSRIPCSNGLNIDESTDQERYENVVFLQGDEAFQPLEILDNKGPEAAMEYLKQWHYPGEHMGSNHLEHGRADKTFEKDGYIMSWNPNIEYIGLQHDSQYKSDNFDTDGINEASGYKKATGYNKDGAEALRRKMLRKTKVNKKINENDIDINEPPTRSDDPNFSDITQHLSSKEFDDKLPGGIGDNAGDQKFSADQIRKGLKVEMEHTDDPLVAMDIVIDHLTEDENYYGDDTQDPEQAAQCGAMTDANNDGTNDGVSDGVNNHEDKEETDILLGFKPVNVGEMPTITESRLSRDDIYKWIEEAIIAEGVDKITADKMMEFGLNQEIIDEESVYMISIDEMNASEMAEKVIREYNSTNSGNIQEYDNYNYPAGADADPRAPWHEKEAPEGHEDDDFEDDGKIEPDEGDYYKDRY